MPKKVLINKSDPNALCLATDILATIDDGVFILDRDWRFVYLNKRAAGIANLQPEDLLGLNIWEKYPHGLGTELEQKYRKCMVEKTPQEFELWGSLSKAWFHVRVYPFKEGILVYWRDITEHRRIETALKESEEKFSKAFHSNQLGTAIIVPSGPIIEINKAFEKITGYSREEVIGRSSFELGLISAEIRDKVHEEVRQKGKIQNLELEIKTKSGEIRHVSQTVDTIKANNQDFILSMFADITERRQAEEALRQAEERFRVSFQFSPVGMVLSTGEGIILDVNENYTRILGATREEIIGKRGLDPDFMPYPEELDRMVRILREQGYLDRFEMTLKKKSGELIRIVTSIIYFRQRDTTYLLGMMLDITERKQMIDAQIRIKDQLEVAVRERTQELAQANNQLRQYSRRIIRVQEEERKRIAYELHDDTAQYLSILKMQIGVLAESPEIRSPQVKERLKYLEKDADRAFNDVRRYSHELRPTTLEYQGLVAALEQIADDFNKLGQLSVEVRVEGMEPELSEETKLGFFRIAQEALNNARKHSKAGHADVDIRFNHKQIRMAVSDNGEGFDVKQALRKSKGKGSLGLMSMKERADLIGAKLKIESKPGSGTTVMVEMPYDKLLSQP